MLYLYFIQICFLEANEGWDFEGITVLIRALPLFPNVTDLVLDGTLPKLCFSLM